MGRQAPQAKENRNNKYVCIGLLAHVDTGKTTLSEAMLYLSRAIRKAGRVDHRDAFLDNNTIEQNRGITVFSKEARFEIDKKNFTLLDTPGHFDFSAEMERTLQVLDCAVLLVSGTDGVQSHTETLWQLLQRYDIPVVVFVNKMDRPNTDRSKIMKELEASFGGGFVEILSDGSFEAEDAAMQSEILMEAYLEGAGITDKMISEAVLERSLFPVCFGSALKMDGVGTLLDVLKRFIDGKAVSQDFGAVVYKISYDRQGARQTHLKVTGGVLKTRQQIETAAEQATVQMSESGSEKIDQIRIYSGGNYKNVSELEAGMVGVVTGLEGTYAGQRLGKAAQAADADGTCGNSEPLLKPALTYRIILPEGEDPAVVMSKLRRLEEEEPTLNLLWNEAVGEIHVQVMGPLELEILQHQIEERFALTVSFGGGSVIYKETIEEAVIGIGHFEPLRHYAEVQLLIEPLPRGSGIVIDSLCSEDKLDRNWQRLILTHLAEKNHPGVLTGSELTDVKISILAGRAHLKHTEGGDFRQATYRAVRQGLRKAKSILLEPYYSFRLEVPPENVGRALTDMQRLGAEVGLPGLKADGQTAFIQGKGPVAQLRDYQRECSAYTRGRGKFIARPAGMFPCNDSSRIIAEKNYLPDEDLENPTGSVFCQHGAAVYVPWDEVDAQAHVDSGYVVLDGRLVRKSQARAGDYAGNSSYRITAAGEKELEEIFLKTYGKSKRDEALRRESMSKGTGMRSGEMFSGSFPQPKWKKEGVADSKGGSLLVIDGYNVIFAWDELKELAAVNLDSAREAFLDILQNYEGYTKTGMIVVFDGYKVAGNPGTKVDYGDIRVVYTREAETADRFIEKTVFDMGRKFDITVVTSDRPVQMAAMGDGAKRLSSREFYQDVTAVSAEIRNKLKVQKSFYNKPFEEKLYDKNVIKK